MTLYPSIINHGAKTNNMNNGSVNDPDVHLYMVRRMSPSAVNQVHRKLVRAPLRIRLLE